MLKAENLNARVIATIESAIHHEAKTEARTKCEAEKVAISFCGTRLLEHTVDAWKCATCSLAISEEVCIVVDKYGDSEVLLEHRAKCYTIAERWEVRQEATDNAITIIRWAREGKAYGNRLLAQLCNDSLEALDKGAKTKVEVVSHRWHSYVFGAGLAVLHCVKNEICATSVKRDDDWLWGILLFHNNKGNYNYSITQSNF